MEREGWAVAEEKMAEWVNVLGKFCGMRDVPELKAEYLERNCGIRRADVMVLFSGSILAGADVLAEAMEEGIARSYVIVGGEGHTTQTLRDMVRKECPQIETEGKAEAEVFQEYLGAVYGKRADYLETRSTNCGNNITYLLKLLRAKGISFESVILCQDATMQRRMDAGLRKYLLPGVRIVNYASYAAEVVAGSEGLSYAFPVHGMWEMDRYVNLLMGEIPRLTDGPDGYGPRGKGFIAHVDVPQEVMDAFEGLKKVCKVGVREADPRYAS